MKCLTTRLLTRSRRALSVRPDVLLGSLAAYDQALPAITAFRLCHAFGKGPNVHVNKLPVEIRTAIEGIIIDSHYKTSMRTGCGAAWKQDFKCFENRCEPRVHVYWFDDRALDWMDDTWDMVDDKCEECGSEDNDYYTSWGEACDECTAKHEYCQSLLAMELDPEESRQDWEADHLSVVARWKKLVESVVADETIVYRTPRDEEGCSKFLSEGMINRPLEILRKHFGLDAEFGDICRDSDAKSKSWTKHAHHGWHEETTNPYQTTVCFLIQPQSSAAQMAEQQTKARSGTGAQPRDVEADESINRRFHRALRLLRLKPYVHPCQRQALRPPPRAVDDKESGLTELTRVPFKDWQWPRLLRKAGNPELVLYFDPINMARAARKSPELGEGKFT